MWAQPSKEKIPQRNKKDKKNLLVFYLGISEGCVFALKESSKPTLISGAVAQPR
jgi:hypothetical protein